MDGAMSLLFDLPGLWVVSCEGMPPDGRRVVVMQRAAEHGCPRCGVLAGGKPYDVREMRVKDVPLGHRPLEVVWASDATAAVSRRARSGYSPSGRCRSRRVAASRCGCRPGWRRRCRGRRGRCRTPHATTACPGGVCTALVDKALTGIDSPREPVRMLGLEETRARSLRWVWEDDGWRLSNPWMTSFVDLDVGRPGWLLGLVPGRSGAVVEAWLGAQPQAWRDGIEVVTLDPSAPFAAAVRRLLPPATIVVDHWHLVRLANQMVTEVRQRVAREQLGHRGGQADPAWAHRRLLLTAGDRLSRRGLARLRHVLAVDDPTNEIGAAWGIKELLRQLLTAPTTHDARQRVFRFYDAVLAADMPETTRLAETVCTWWPAVEAFLRLRVTNARTEGSNRVIKQFKRVGCGYRNQANYERRIVLHVAARSAA